jgi:hypothetical protein
MAGRQVQVNQDFEDHGSREVGLLTRTEMVLETVYSRGQRWFSTPLVCSREQRWFLKRWFTRENRDDSRIVGLRTRNKDGSRNIRLRMRTEMVLETVYSREQR